MFLPDDSTAVAVMPTPAPAGTPGYFSNGNPATGTPATILSADYMNGVAQELINVVTAGGLSPSKTTFNQLATSIKNIAANAPYVVGAMRNGRMALSTASETALFTADQIVVASSLTGLAYKLGSFSKSINLSIVGAGGMDTDSAPTSGYVALYAIYNPSTEIASILAVNTTSSIAPEIYAGSNMPSGYTASSLISVWRTTSSRQFVTGYQFDRTIAFAKVSAFGISNDVYNSISGTFSVAGVVPKNAFCIFGMLSMGASGTTNYGFSFGGLNAVGMSGYDFYSQAPFSDLYFATPQTLTYGVGTGSQPVSVGMDIYGYKF